MVRACHADYNSEVGLICFSSIEEAIQAKTGLDKNPSISGVQVSAEFASEADIKDLCEQFELNIDTATSLSSSVNSTNPTGQEGGAAHGGWPGTGASAPSAATELSAVPTISQATPLSLSEINSSSTASSWESSGEHATGGSTHFSRQVSERSTTSTPGSMWSDGGFLSGFSSPWLSSGPTP